VLDPQCYVLGRAANTRQKAAARKFLYFFVTPAMIYGHGAYTADNVMYKEFLCRRQSAVNFFSMNYRFSGILLYRRSSTV
jgi:hypothetical protein